MVDEKELEVDGTGDSGAALSIPSSAGAVKKGGYCILGGKPCKMVDVSFSKTGKHGPAKANLTGLDIFTGQKVQDVMPSAANVLIPTVKRTDYQVVYLDDDFLHLLAEGESEIKQDLKLPTTTTGEHDEIAQQIKKMFDEGKTLIVSVIAAMGIEKVIAVKEAANS